MLFENHKRKTTMFKGKLLNQPLPKVGMFTKKMRELEKAIRDPLGIVTMKKELMSSAQWLRHVRGQ